MKRFLFRLVFALTTASLLLTACSSPTAVSPTSTQVQATPTVEASATSAPPTETPAPTSTQPPTATQAPTNTPLPTLATTPTQPPQPTGTPGTPAASPTTPPSSTGAATARINENTNCRSGPSADYSVIVVLLSGTDVKVVSRTTLDDYLLVENPENPPETCWMWTQYVTTSGDLASLPVATPPPPLVNYTIGYVLVKECDGYQLEFKVTNTGVKTVQAYNIVVKDKTSNTQQTASSTVFDLLDGCSIVQAIGYIDPAKVGYVYSGDFSYAPTGHSMEATITICSHNDMTGVCVTQVLKFTP